MFRNKYISAFIAFVLFGSLTLADAGSLTFELEESESREIEKEEELREGFERDWIKLLLGGNADLVSSESSEALRHSLILAFERSNPQEDISHTGSSPLYIAYCCLKLHHS